MCSFCPIIIQTVSLPCSLPLQGAEGTQSLQSLLFSVPFSFTFSFFSLYCSFSGRCHFLCAYFFLCLLYYFLFFLVSFWFVCLSFFLMMEFSMDVFAWALSARRGIGAMISFPLLVQMVTAARFILAL